MLKKVYSASNPTDAAIVQALLESHDIRADLRGFHDAHFAGTRPEVWVEAEDEATVAYLIKHGEMPPAGAAPFPVADSRPHSRPESRTPGWSIILNILLVPAVVALTVLWLKAKAPLDAPEDNGLYITNFDDEENCLYGHWKSDNKLAFIECYNADSGLTEKYTDFSIGGKKTGEYFDRNQNGIFEYGREYGPEGDLMDEWVDDDDDGFTDRIVWYEANGKTREQVFRGLKSRL
jgi:hypothetical protein